MVTLQNQKLKQGGEPSAIGLAAVVLRGLFGRRWRRGRTGYDGSMSSVSARSGTMTARQFEKAARECRLSPMMLSRARRVLVKGESVRDVANSDRVSTQTVNTAIRMVSTPPDEIDDRLFI